MAFEVVASGRAEQQRVAPVRNVIKTGLQIALAGVFVAVVGILGMFNNRPIIVGELTLGYATIGLLFLTTGILVATQRLYASAAHTLIAGLVAGTIASATFALLPVAMSLINLRSVFVALDAPLYKMLTFGLSAPVGIAVFVGLGTVLGFLGALLIELPRLYRRPLAGGLIAVGLAGLFQELLRPILYNSSVTKPVHDLLYGWYGLILQGAIIIFVVTAAGVVIWDRYHDGMTSRYGTLVLDTQKRIRWSLILAAAVLGLLFPIYAGNFIGQVLLTVGLFTLMGMGLNLEVGIAGLLDLGFVAFYATGAYATGLLMADSPYALAHLSFWQAMPIAVLCSVILGFIFGIPVLKVRGDYLAVATLGLGEIVRVIVLSDAAAPLLGGAHGVLQIPRPYLGTIELNNPVALFYLTLVASAVAAYAAWRLEESRLGRAWKAIRDDEDVAQALGINLIRVKLLAYGLGAAFAGLAGSIFATMLGSIFPHSFQLIISINILALIIVGGMGSLVGVALGAVVLIGLPEMLREFGEFRYLFYGLAIVAVMRIKPEGLWPSAAKRRELRIDAEIEAVQHGETLAAEQAAAVPEGKA
jgi:branched-chain amino acid transport system permease protein